MRFAHISDLHLRCAPGTDPAVKEHALAVTKAMTNDLKRIASVLDFIVLSGDITDDAHPNSFAEAARLFSSLALSVFTVPGNHDGPSAYFQMAQRGFIAESDITGRVVNLGALRLLGLNTCLENETTGSLAAEQVDLVTRELANGDDAPLIIVMHHPPFPPGLQEFDAIAHLDGAADLAMTLQDAATAPIILSGHVHRIYQARWHGAACFVAGSPTLPFTSEHPFGDTPIRPTTGECRYFVHSLSELGTHVVTPQPFSYDTGSERNRRPNL